MELADGRVEAARRRRSQALLLAKSKPFTPPTGTRTRGADPPALRRMRTRRSALMGHPQVRRRRRHKPKRVASGWRVHATLSNSAKVGKMGNKADGQHVRAFEQPSRHDQSSADEPKLLRGAWSKARNVVYERTCLQAHPSRRRTPQPTSTVPMVVKSPADITQCIHDMLRLYAVTWRSRTHPKFVISCFSSFWAMFVQSPLPPQRHAISTTFTRGGGK